MFVAVLRRILRNLIAPAGSAVAALDDGKRLSAAGDHAAAAHSFTTAIELEPTLAEAHFRLGLALRDQQQLIAAAESYRRAIALKADYVEAHNNLGSVLQLQGRVEAALASYRHAVALDPDFAQPYLNLGRLLADAGDRAGAADCYRHAIARGIDGDSFQHLLSALDGETTARAPAAYTRNLFDGFAADFDRRLVEDLDYQLPAVLAARIRALQPRRDLRVLDLGCGTGLCGDALAGCCAVLTGVDLSAAMLEKARARGLYHALIEADVVAWLQGGSLAGQQQDVVIAADVFIYIGDLSALFAAAAAALTSGGLFVFSIEVTEEQDYRLQPSGRYAQSRQYISRLAAGIGFIEVEASAQHLRGDISGCGYVLRKT